MTKEQLINFCLEMPDSSVDYPYGPDVEVIRNKAGKSFALIGICQAEPMKRSCGTDAPIKDGDVFITLKCPPELIFIFRDQYKSVLPGYYSNKNHWNTIILGKDLPIEELKKMILLSFDLVTPQKKK
ncbi:MAG: MmcQ/YjbR family DNA-binding protein [Firmicutes bacterium]|nr:MmcQ/YjbR family DNA-binding protein [Bacillota bacterium]